MTDLNEMATGADVSDNGNSIEDFAENGEGLEPALPPIPGESRQLTLIAGGEEPTTASMKLKGGSIPVEGEFEKGEGIELAVIARVVEIDFVDQMDRSGYVLGCERRHVARIEGVRRIEE